MVHERQTITGRRCACTPKMAYTRRRGGHSRLHLGWRSYALCRRRHLLLGQQFLWRTGSVTCTILRSGKRSSTTSLALQQCYMWGEGYCANLLFFFQLKQYSIRIRGDRHSNLPSVGAYACSRGKTS